MGAILAITLPVFLLIGLGFAAAKSGAFGPEHARLLGRFVLMVALPALIFQSLATRHFEEIVQPEFLAVYGLASLGAFAAAFAWFRFAARIEAPRSAIRAMGASFSNTGFIGLPIALQLFGPAAAVPVAMAMIVENLVMFPVGLGISNEEARSPGAMLLNFARTPIILAIVAGTLCALLAVPIPGVIGQTIGMLAAASAPVALFATGMGLVGVRLKGGLPAIAPIVLGKLVLHPLLVLLLMLAIPIPDPMLRAAVLLLAALPMFSVFPVLSQQQGDGETGGGALLLATALSFATIPALLWLIGQGIAP